MTELAQGGTIEGLRGRWTIEHRHREGGFGVTFLARDSASGERVVIKQLRFDRLRDWKSLELFEREGAVLAELSHPSIPGYRDFFAHDGASPIDPSQAGSYGGQGKLSFFLVQQYVPGQTLEERVESAGPLSAAEVEAIAQLLLETLDYLHSLSPPVVHRDISPRNIILSGLSKPFLVDFGAIQDRLRFDASSGSTTVGSLGYMPPEQLRGAARPASDLYALGMTLLFAASGVQPSAMPVDDATGKVRVSAVARHLPAHLAGVIDRMVEPAVGPRVGSAREAIGLLREGAVAPAPRGQIPVPILTASLAGVLALASVGVGFALLRKQPPPAAPPQAARPIFPAVLRPVATASPSSPAAPGAAGADAQPGGAATPGAVPGGNSAPDGALSGVQSLSFKGKVKSAQGVALSPGAACTLTARGQGASAKEARVSGVKLVCGSQTLYDEGAELNGTSMSSYGLGEEPDLGAVGRFRYQLVYSDIGARVGERAQITLDTRAGQAAAFRETVPSYRVEVAIEKLSEPVDGKPLFAANVPPFAKVIERQGKVTKVNGPAPVPRGASCKLVMSPGNSTGHTCRVAIRCGQVALYAGGPSDGYVACSLENGEPVGFEDTEPSSIGGDPQASFDLKAGTGLVADDTKAGRYEVSLELAR